MATRDLEDLDDWDDWTGAGGAGSVGDRLTRQAARHAALTGALVDSSGATKGKGGRPFTPRTTSLLARLHGFNGFHGLTASSSYTYVNTELFHKFDCGVER